ncbi:MAG TPA: EpsI family protein [Candidatus Acidoferrales bacterium]|nr:EpsI family protein [Candidatus Acidoferrales bacterium]
MNSRGMTIRLCIVALVLVGGVTLLHAMSHGEPVVAHQPLHDLPYTIGNWNGQEQPLEQRIVEAVSVTDYTNRLYMNPAGAAVQLYVGYYSTQRTGDTIHSPKNCLPGAGWDPIRSDYTTIRLDNGREIVVNEYVIANGLDKQLVFYWYQGRGRVIASEYWGKFWMISDAITRNRTDGALVRLITPIARTGDFAEAHARLVKFTQGMFPHLNEVIPN